MSDSLASQIIEHIRARSESFHDKRPNNSSNANDENISDPSKQFQDALLKGLFKEIEKDLLGYNPWLMEKGRVHGKILLEDTEPHIKILEQKYENFGKMLVGISERNSIKDVEEARETVEILTSKIAILHSKLDESDENSEVSKLQKEITVKKAILRQFEKDNYENFFIQKYYEVLEQRLKEDQDFLSTFNKEGKEIREGITQPLVKFTKEKLDQKINIREASSKNESNTVNLTSEERLPFQNPEDKINFWSRILISLGIKKETSSSNGEKKSREIKDENLRDFGNFIHSVGSIDTQKEQILRDKVSTYASPVYDGILNAILNLSPIIPPRRQIITYYIIALTILFGEFYLVYEVITKVLNINPPSNFSAYFNPPINLSIILFCLAYPLSIGMLIKFRFSDPKARDTFKKEFSKNWVQYVIFSLVLVGSLSGLTLQNSERQISEFVENIGFENAKGIIAVYKIVVLSIFLPVITIVLAAVGAIFLSEAFDLHKQYRHVTQLSLWKDPAKLKKGKEDFPSQINKEIEHIQDKIIKLQKEKESLEDKYIHAKALVNVQKSPPRFEDLINTLKSIAISLYMSGYELGKAETLSGLDETELILYLEKRKKI